jgi:anti-sigma B factor antagonist
MTWNSVKTGTGQSTNLLVAVAESERTVFVRISGRATCETSKNLKDLLTQLTQCGYQKFVLDLTDCLIMDSTILGLVAGFGVKLARSAGVNEAGRVRLLNPNQRVTDLFDNLGVTQFFDVLRGVSLQAGQYVPVSAPAAPATREEIAQTSLDAHQFLMEINPANIPKFKDVAQFLAEDLARMRKPKD